MSSGGVKTKVQTYDPSVYNSRMEAKRSDLVDEVTKRAFGAAKEANIYGEKAMEHLNDGLGFLSQYLDQRRSQTTIESNLAKDATSRAANLRQDAIAGAGFTMGAMNEYMSQAQQADAEFSKQVRRKVTQ